jgi:hypothetical protein
MITAVSAWPLAGELKSRQRSDGNRKEMSSSLAVIDHIRMQTRLVTREAEEKELACRYL